MDLLVLQLQLTTLAVGLLFLIVAAVTIWQTVEIVDAYEKEALTVFGEYRKLLEPGFNIIPPFVSRTYAFDMRTQTLDVPQQEAITRDNSPVTADAVVYIKVMDAKKAFLEVDNYKRAVSNLAQTTLRAVLGDMELDDTLNKRQEINAKIRKELDEPTDEWGIRVESVEVREVNPSKEVQQAMEQQTSAERRRRAMILEAQGERRSAVETAEGDKQSDIIRAQGEKQSQILEAQGDAISTVLRAKSAEAMGERAIIERGMEASNASGRASPRRSSSRRNSPRWSAGTARRSPAATSRSRRDSKARSSTTKPARCSGSTISTRFSARSIRPPRWISSNSNRRPRRSRPARRISPARRPMSTNRISPAPISTRPMSTRS
jgi:SPFH domain, Band 7 family protein